MTSRHSPRRAEILAELSRRDRVLAGLVERHGPAPLDRPVPVDARFAVLVRSIVSQQLAGSAARSIHARLTGLLGDVTPESILEAGPDALGACGLSGAKTAALVDLAERAAGGQVDLGRIGRLGDDEVVEHLVQVRGIGVWTAQMFLMMALRRPDVWPVGDLGVRIGYAAAWRQGALVSPAELQRLGEPFRPYRSTVAWYCWRVADAAKQDGARTP